MDSIRSVFVFDGIIRSAVHELKYRNLQFIAGCLSQYMAEYFQENKLTGDILMAVPMHERKIKRRGYNQSELLAKEISNKISIPVISGAIKRVKDNRPQARTTCVEERRINMENAFTCVSNDINGKEVIIIDDVCTSGATLEACAAVLKERGAKKVSGFTLAREIYDRR